MIRSCLLLSIISVMYPAFLLAAIGLPAVIASSSSVHQPSTITSKSSAAISSTTLRSSTLRKTRASIPSSTAAAAPIPAHFSIRNGYFLRPSDPSNTWIVSFSITDPATANSTDCYQQWTFPRNSGSLLAPSASVCYDEVLLTKLAANIPFS